MSPKIASCSYFSPSFRSTDVELRLRFNDDTPAIWNSQGKRYVYSRLAEAKRKYYQEKLDEFLLRGSGSTFDFKDDPDFLFRYASAGTLPIITLRMIRVICSTTVCFIAMCIQSVGISQMEAATTALSC
jgi:hypothetical protein